MKLGEYMYFYQKPKQVKGLSTAGGPGGKSFKCYFGSAQANVKRSPLKPIRHPQWGYIHTEPV